MLHVLPTKFDKLLSSVYLSDPGLVVQRPCRAPVVVEPVFRNYGYGSKRIGHVFLNLKVCKVQCK